MKRFHVLDETTDDEYKVVFMLIHTISTFVSLSHIYPYFHRIFNSSNPSIMKSQLFLNRLITKIYI